MSRTNQMLRLSQFRTLYNSYNPGGFKKYVYHFNEQFKGIYFDGKNILEIGCGKGFISLWIALIGRPKKIVALDEFEGVGSDKDSLKYLEEYAKLLNFDYLKIVKSDIMENNFQDNTFDIIISNNSLHHVVRTGKYISTDEETRRKWLKLFMELKRLLKPEGRLFVGEYSRNNIWRFSPIKLRFKQIDWKIHPTLKEWLEIVNAAAFKNVKYRIVINYKLRNLYFIFGNRFASFFLNSSFNIYATK